MSEAQKFINKEVIIEAMIKANTHLHLNKETGLPFKTREEAVDLMRNEYINADKNVIRSVSFMTPLYIKGVLEGEKERIEVSSGFVISNYMEFDIYYDIERGMVKEKYKDKETGDQMTRMVEAFVRQESYWWTTFSARGESETIDVHISVNGEQLVIQRMIEVPMPQRFLSAADNAIYPVYNSNAEASAREIESYKRTYPYQRGTRSSYEQYTQYKRGDIKSRADITSNTNYESEIVIS